MDFEVQHLGLLDYGTAYALQKKAIGEIAEGSRPNTLFLLEHPEVYTYGRRSGEGPRPPGKRVFEVERGGEATFHNPGQLVGYPLFHLEGGDRDVHRFLRHLEAALIHMLSDFAIEAGTREGATGVWVQDGTKKIASIGIAVSRWVTYHGFALNVCNDLSGFSQISPCGFSPQVMTSLEKELGGKAPPLTEVKASLLFHLRDLFQARLEPALLTKRADLVL